MKATSNKPDFAAVQARLKTILQKLDGKGLSAKRDGTYGYELVGPVTERSRGREVWFGAVQIKKNYVSYHLMPVYAFPDLLDGMSPALKKRMQGKSCFNFTSVDEQLFAELAALTDKGYQRFKDEKLILD